MFLEKSMFFWVTLTFSVFSYPVNHLGDPWDFLGTPLVYDFRNSQRASKGLENRSRTANCNNTQPITQNRNRTTNIQFVHPRNHGMLPLYFSYTVVFTVGYERGNTTKYVCVTSSLCSKRPLYHSSKFRLNHYNNVELRPSYLKHLSLSDISWLLTRLFYGQWDIQGEWVGDVFCSAKQPLWALCRQNTQKRKHNTYFWSGPEFNAMNLVSNYQKRW